VKAVGSLFLALFSQLVNHKKYFDKY